MVSSKKLVELFALSRGRVEFTTAKEGRVAGTTVSPNTLPTLFASFLHKALISHGLAAYAGSLVESVEFIFWEAIVDFLSFRSIHHITHVFVLDQKSYGR